MEEWWKGSLLWPNGVICCEKGCGVALSCSALVAFIWFGLYRGPRRSEIKGISDTSCCSCLHTLVGSLAEVSCFFVSKWKLEKQFLWLCSWWFHCDYRVCWTSCGVVGKQAPGRAKSLQRFLPKTAPGDFADYFSISGWNSSQSHWLE